MEIKIWQEIDDFELITYKAKVEIVYDNICKEFERHTLNALIEVVDDYIRETFE